MLLRVLTGDFDGDWEKREGVRKDWSVKTWAPNWPGWASVGPRDRGRSRGQAWSQEQEALARQGAKALDVRTICAQG